MGPTQVLIAPCASLQTCPGSLQAQLLRTLHVKGTHSQDVFADREPNCRDEHKGEGRSRGLQLRSAPRKVGSNRTSRRGFRCMVSENPQEQESLCPCLLPERCAESR